MREVSQQDDRAVIAAAHRLEVVGGGGVSKDSIAPLRRVRATRLDRFETRKVVFDAGVLDGGQVERGAVEKGLALAIEFELLWLQNKRDYYGTIAREDEPRIARMEARATPQPPVRAAA